ncbi:MAG: CRP/FNR family cyclic AMP-dependent transcriptional regulator [Verrucomicrobiales bacterium]|jgi:CRP/FNR family cyclic AMP-dependent transcriptional regulator
MQTKHFNPGDEIFHEGDAHSHEAFLIASGRVAITVHTESGEKLIAQLKAGDLFGEMGLIDENPRSATARAVEPTKVEVVDEETFEHAIIEKPKRLRRYLKKLYERLRTVDTLLQAEINRRGGGDDGDRAHRSVESLMASALAAGPHHKSGNHGISLPTFAVKLKSHYKENADFHYHVVDAEIEHFPFLIGRHVSDTMAPFVSNDLQVVDHAPYSVSKNHCSIEHHFERFLLRDRGSTLGTIVNGEVLSIRTGHLVSELHEGDNQIVLGSPESPHKFSLVLERSFDIETIDSSSDK